jgi:hypothetical protein
MQDQYPIVVDKSKVLDTYSAEAVAAGSFYGPAVEVPRGATDIRFQVDGTLFDRTTGDETYTFKIQHRASPSHSWVDVPSAAFTTISATTGYEQVPTAANAPGVSVARWVRAVLTTVGTSPIATAVVRMLYRLPAGAGLQYESGEVGG